MLSRVTGETIRERSKRSAEQSKCRNVSTTDQTVRSDCPTVSKSDQVQGTLRMARKGQQRESQLDTHVNYLLRELRRRVPLDQVRS
jgi:hypothetical protein